MRFITTSLGLILIGLLLKGCLFPPYKYRAKDIQNSERKPIVWQSEKSSIRVFPKVRIRMRPHNMIAGKIKLDIQSNSPTKGLRFLSEEVKIYYLDETEEHKVFLKIQENSISNEELKTSKRVSFEVVGIISEEIFRSDIPIDTFYVEFPDIIYNQLTHPIDPVGFYTYHWTEFLFRSQRNSD